MGWYVIYLILMLLGLIAFIGAIAVPTTERLRWIAVGLALWLLVSVIIEFRVVVNY